MSQPDAWLMIRRLAAATGIATEIGCQTFRATGITPTRPVSGNR
jgi:integrase/recombinase XerD